MKKILSILFLFYTILNAGVSIIPLDSSQTNLREAYRYAFYRAKETFIKRGEIDTNIANEFGEVPLIISGKHKGFIYPDTLSPSRAFLHRYEPTFEISTIGNSFSFKWIGNPGVAIYKSSILDPYDQTVSWSLPYYEDFFRNILGLNLGSEVVIIIDSMLTTIPLNVRLLIIPAFEHGDSSSEYIYATQEYYPELGEALRMFLRRGGTIFAEGNACYLLELYGILPDGSISLHDPVEGIGDDMNSQVSIIDTISPLGIISRNEIYTPSGPTISPTLHGIVARFTSTRDSLDIGKPAIVFLEGDEAFGGRIILSAGLPSVRSIIRPSDGGWQWLANAVVLAFSERATIFRSIFTNVIAPTELSPMALPADTEHIFEITIRIRNLWSRPLQNVTITETYKLFFDYVNTEEGPEPIRETNRLTYTVPSIAPLSEYKIKYRLKTPPPSDPRAREINRYLDYDVYMRPSTNYTIFDDPESFTRRSTGQWNLLCYFLFNARIVADTDLNWKNILGNYFQPFKIFMTMENKERTSALETKYVQYIPLDIPVLWVDPSRSTPIVRTPGGRFVDLLRGSEDRNANGTLEPEELQYDMDNDGDPDCWLDIKSFHPMPDTLTLEYIYWLNPWTNEYEDIDMDGIRAVDIDRDGIFEIEDPDDKIRAYRAVWLFGTITGYQWYDPRCSWEIWIDPPDLVQMAIGAPDTLGYDGPDSGGFFYPNWQRWMNRNESNEIVMRRLIYHTSESYTGYSFETDTYIIRPGDIDMGYVPYPKEEYICILNFGGKDPTMSSPTPESSPYANIHYKTVWGHEKITPIRTSYTYYAPLPNPLQFEFISTTYELKDPSTGRILTYLPGNGNAEITFTVTASTEYSLYWIKLAGRDVDGDGMGDGVFGYIIHNIPKGLGGYSIELARTSDGSFDIPSIVPDYHPVDLIDTTIARDVEIWEYPFYYSIYIPQVLIPAAVDDDNGDGIDDWLDDFGDRFVSETGYLYDEFPIGTGTDAERIYGVGWWNGPDNQYGDDMIEKLGSVSYTIKAKFIGRGKEGEIKLNDGTYLVCEEIFGGSPWVLWSHTQSGYAIANNISISRGAEPTLVSLHPDTTMLKFHITDIGEPHLFDEFFDPFHFTIGKGNISITTHTGGKDPCGLLQPDYLSYARIDPNFDTATVTAIPFAESDSILSRLGYPRRSQGAFVQFVIEVNNNSDEHWYDFSIRPELTSIGSSELFLWYAVYPRPLVPGDDPRTFRQGWRFNPSAREVLMRPGEPDGSATIPEILATRRAYFIFTIKLDRNLPVGVYDVPFTFTGRAKRYNETTYHPITGVEIPPAKFAIVRRNPAGIIVASPYFVIGTATLTEFRDILRGNITTLLEPELRYSTSEPHFDNFYTYSPVSTIITDSTIIANLPFTTFPPSPSLTNFYLSALAKTEPKLPSENEPLDYGASITYTDYQGIARQTGTSPVYVTVRGSRLVNAKQILEVNDTPVSRDGYYTLNQGENTMKIGLIIRNRGNDIATEPNLKATIAENIRLISADTLYTSFYDSVSRTIVFPEFPDILPGERRTTWVKLGLPSLEGREAVDIMYTFTAEYNPEHYKAINNDTIRYGLDLFILSDELRVSNPNPQRGEDIVLTAKIHHAGIAEAKNVPVRALYTTGDRTLNQIGTDLIIPRLSFYDSVYTATFRLTFPTDENVYFQKIIVAVDPDSAFGETNEKNNVASITLTYGKGNPIRNVLNYPNPFKTITDFTYILTYPVDKVTIKIYTLSGKKIMEITNAPTRAGYNYITWYGKDKNGKEIGNGTYIYRVIAEVGSKKYEVRERAVKME